jgi:hypothetical protein
MLDIHDGEQPSYRAKSWLRKGLRRRRAGALSRLLSDVLRRHSSPLSGGARNLGLRDFCHGLLV